MSYAVPEHYGWRCAGDHKHPHGEACPDNYAPHEERPDVFIEYLFDTEQEAKDYIANTRAEKLREWATRHGVDLLNEM